LNPDKAQKGQKIMNYTLFALCTILCFTPVGRMALKNLEGRKTTNKLLWKLFKKYVPEEIKP